MSNPIIVADGGTSCFYCGEFFDPDDVPTVKIPSGTLYRCPNCYRWPEVE